MAKSIEFERTRLEEAAMLPRPARNTLVSKLSDEPSGRIGKLFNQLQILGMDPWHLSRLEMQLSSALGDDTGKKLRILQQAIQRLIHDRTYPPLPRSPREAERAPADPEWVRREATLVRRYNSGREWEEGIATPKPRLALVEGDDFPMMHDGSIRHVREVVGVLAQRVAGRPMLSASIMCDVPEFLGDTQLGLSDAARALQAKIVPDIEAKPVVAVVRTASGGESAADAKSREREWEKAKQKAKVQQSEWTKLNASIFHPEQNQTAHEMWNTVFKGGRSDPDLKALAPMPGPDFWRCFLICQADSSKPGSRGGYRLLPPIQLTVPETVCFADPHGYCGVYTDSDGFLYRQVMSKDEALEWLLRMRTARLASLERREKELDAGGEGFDPRFVVRKGNSGGGSEARLMFTDQELKGAMSESSSTAVLFQGFVRSQGGHARIFRCIQDLESKTDSAHYVLTATATMGNPEGRGGGGGGGGGAATALTWMGQDQQGGQR